MGLSNVANMLIRRVSSGLLWLGLAGCSEGNDLQPLIPALVERFDGDGQSADVGSLLPHSLRVRVIDAAGNEAPSVTVSWSVLQGGGTIAPTSSTTGQDGIASADFILGPE